MRALVEISVRRPVSVVMVAVAVAAFGVVGYQRLAVELFPDISYPSLTVQTEFPDTAPEEVETLVTRPVEEAVGVVRGLRSIHSVSRSGVSEVVLDFDWGSEMSTLSMEVREKLDRLILPDGAEDPIVLRFDPSMDPIVRLAVYGSEDLTELRWLAERKLKQDFETVPGVASATIKGGLEEEIQVDVDQERLAALNIPLERVRQVVGVSNVNMPGGALRGADTRYLIRTVNEYDDVEEIAQLVVWRGEGGLVRLGDVAEVRRGSKEREEITRVNGREAVEIDIFKEGDANTVQVARALQERIVAWNAGKLPPNHELVVLFDQSAFVKSAVDEVRNAALIGGALAILILFVFLRDFRSTIVIATSIPLSVVAALLLMYRFDISLNIMSLGGLTLGIGMLVDNSIVVLESIDRKLRAGVSRRRAAVDGTVEVGSAVMASTLTTVAVFLPIVFVEGVAGQLFGDQALTVTFSLLASLVAAITLIPMLSSLGAQTASAAQASAVAPSASVSSPVINPGSGEDPGVFDADRLPASLGRLSGAYGRILDASLRRPLPVVLTGFAIFALSVMAVSRLDTELIPALTEGEFYFELRMPEGTALAATDRQLQSMEKSADGEDAVALYYTTVGSRLVAGGMSLNTKAENLGQLNIVMADRGNDLLEEELLVRLQDRYQGQPDVEIRTGRPSYFSLKTPVEVLLFSDNLELLRDWSLEVARELEGIDGLVDVRSSLEAGSPEVQVLFHRDRVAQMGLDLGVLSETLRDRVQGDVPTRFKEEDRQIDIRVRNAEDARSSVRDIERLMIPGADGQPIRLLTVADVQMGRGPAEVHRVQQQRAAVISADLRGRSLGSAMQEVEQVMQAIPRPMEIGVEMGGQNQEMQRSFASLRFAILLAIFLVYLVMAATFESFLHPFLVLFTIPLALVGVVAGLMATGTTISVIVLIGTVMLVGIVVNNAIVLIDTINRLRRKGMAKLDAVTLAGRIRLRPILMTTVTTILGLVPMALSFGEGAELRAPLAITVACGLAFSTVLTLLVIPAAYMVVPSKVRLDEEGA